MMRYGATGHGMGPEKVEQELSFGLGSMLDQMKSMNREGPSIGSHTNDTKG